MTVIFILSEYLSQNESLKKYGNLIRAKSLFVFNNFEFLNADQ